MKTWGRQYKSSETDNIESMNRLMDWLPKNVPPQQLSPSVVQETVLSYIGCGCKEPQTRGCKELQTKVCRSFSMPVRTYDIFSDKS